MAEQTLREKTAKGLFWGGIRAGIGTGVWCLSGSCTECGGLWLGWYARYILGDCQFHY